MTNEASVAPAGAAVDPLESLVALCAGRRVVALTGAGCSTESGIPDYRGPGTLRRARNPIQFRDYVRDADARRRYWARSLLGWPAFSRARPGPTHRALARLEAIGLVHRLVTQNVDRLHQRAGSRRVIDLHGRNDRLVCLGCRGVFEREAFQVRLARANPAFVGLAASLAPDGDADPEAADFARFEVPGCSECGGALKPDVVFFGDAVPRSRVERAYAALTAADALLAVGTSLMVYSAFRFCRAAAEQGKPILIVNRGRTRADALAAVKVDADSAPVLEALEARLGVPRGAG